MGAVEFGAILGVILVSILVMAGGVSAAITTLIVDDPNGGEYWSGIQEITWTVITDGGGEPASTEYDVAYSPDSGTNWVNIKQGISRGERSWSWDTTPYEESSTALIRVKDYSTDIQDVSENVFEVDNTAPFAINNLAATAVANGDIQLEWTATGDDDGTGTATSYVVKYSNSEIITQEEFNSATTTTYSQSWTPKSSGDSETEILTGFTDGQTYYFAIEAVDNAGNQGGLSDSPSATSDATPPTVTLSYSDVDEIVKSGDALTITADFSEAVQDSPTPQIAIDYQGSACDLSATDMAKVSNMQYTYEVTVPSDVACDGTAIVTITAKDIAGNDVSTITNDDFVVDNTKPTVDTVTVTPDSVNDDNLALTITVVFTETGSGMDTTVSPTVQITGLTTDPYTVTESSYLGTTWVGTVTLSDNEEEASGTVTVTAAKDVVGNIMDDNTNAGTFIVDTITPDAATISIASGDAVTKDSTPILTLTPGANTPDFMQFSCDGLTWSAWVAWATSHESFDITTGAGCSLGDGEKTVYIQVKDNNGNIQATTNSDAIIYDSDNTLTVDDSGGADFTLIQDAIDAASLGDTINVADGDYDEIITVSKNVTLLGANYDVDPAGSTDRGDESIISGGRLTITADDVTVNGFKMTGEGIYTDLPSALNAIISYNILVDIGGTRAINLYVSAAPDYHLADGGYVGYNTLSSITGTDRGISTYANDDVTIEHNHILNIAGDGIVAYNGDDLTVEHNQILDVGGIAIQVGNHVGTGIKILENTITNPGQKGINYWAGTGGLISGNTITGSGWEAIFTDAEYTLIVDNIIHNCHIDTGAEVWYSYASIHLNRDATYSADHSVVDGNTVSGGIHGIQTWADYTTITNNEIYDMAYYEPVYAGGFWHNNFAIRVGSWWDPILFPLDPIMDPEGVAVNNNNIHDNYWGLFHSDYLENVVDAKNNWWGDVTGPTHSSNPSGTGDAISDNVDYEPWLYSSYPDSTPPTFESVTTTDFDTYYVDGDAITIIADLNERWLTVTGDFSNIEAGSPETAVDNGDGTYTITHTITSATSDGTKTIIINAEDQFENSASDNSFSVLIDNSKPIISTVELSDYTVKEGTTITITSDGTDPQGLKSCWAFLYKDAVEVTGSGESLSYTAENECDGTYTLPSDLADGDYEIRVRATNKIDVNSWASSSVLKIDDTAPTVVLSDDHADTIVRDADTVVITATFTEADQIDEVTPPTITIADIGVTNAAMVKTSNLVWTYSWDVPAGNDGAHAVSITATDRAGNANTAATGKTSYTIDNTAPTVVLSDDHADTIVRDADTVVITATFTEAGSGIDETTVPKITIGGVVTNADMTKTSNLVWTYSWDVSADNDGNVAVSITATDVAGNSNAAATGEILYTIDNTDPITAEITSPQDGDYVTGTAIIEANAGDNVGGSGINRVEFYVNPDGEPLCIVTEEPYECEWDTTGENDGSHDLWIVAYDNAKNSLESDTITVVVDNTVPTAEISYPDGEEKYYITGTIDIGGSVYDENIAGWILEYCWYAECEELASCEGSECNIDDNILGTWDTTGADDGEYELVLTATDLAGLDSFFDVFVFVDNTAPEIKEVYPENSSTIYNQLDETEIMMSALIIDEGSGMKNVTLKIDGNVKDIRDYNGQYEVEPEGYVTVLEGMHIASITACDMLGQCSERIWEFSLKRSFELELEGGLNLVSIPLEPISTNPNDVIGDAPVEVVWTYYPNEEPSQRWKAYYPDNPDFSDLEEMTHGKGYWIISNGPVVIETKGSSPWFIGEHPSVPSYTVTEDTWNLIGFTWYEPMWIGDYLANLWNSILEIQWLPWEYNSEYHPPLHPMESWDEFELGRGYWVYADKDAEIGPGKAWWISN